SLLLRHAQSSPLFPYATLFRSLQAMADRNLARGQVDQSRGDEEGADATDALFLQHDGRVGDGAQAADARPDHDAGRFLVVFRFRDRKSTRLNSSHVKISYAVFC